jgi:hypothetical protein
MVCIGSLCCGGFSVTHDGEPLGEGKLVVGGDPNLSVDHACLPGGHICMNTHMLNVVALGTIAKFDMAIVMAMSVVYEVRVCERERRRRTTFV